jgi:dipeptidyl-peptidase-4
MAIAVAPVTNWRFYDSIYTERYMQTPQENPSGYDENSPINHVDKLKGFL